MIKSKWNGIETRDGNKDEVLGIRKLPNPRIHIFKTLGFPTRSPEMKRTPTPTLPWGPAPSFRRIRTTPSTQFTPEKLLENSKYIEEVNKLIG